MSSFIAHAAIVVEGDTFEQAIENYAAENDLKTAFELVVEHTAEDSPSIDALLTELAQMRKLAFNEVDITRLTAISKRVKKLRAEGADEDKVNECTEHLHALVLGG